MTCLRPHHPCSKTAVPPPSRRTARGFSMTEMVWVVAIMGILAAVVITSIGQVIKGSELTAATQKMEMLNTALANYAQTGQEILYTPMPGSAADETVVLRYLQGRSPTNPQAGSPFVSPNYQPVGSSNPDDYRLVWMGSQYALLTPGQAGTGLKVPFDGSDIGAAWVQPPSWQPYGK